MAKMIFVNLPVADVAKSVVFYEAVGFTRNDMFSNEQAASMMWSDEIVVMIVDHAFYQSFIPGRTIADTRATSAALIALSRDSRAEVDSITEAAIAAGGKEPREPQDMGFMYGRSFEDLDGNIFEPVFMDMAAAMAMHPDGPVHPAEAA